VHLVSGWPAAAGVAVAVRRPHTALLFGLVHYKWIIDRILRREGTDCMDFDSWSLRHSQSLVESVSFVELCVSLDES
jgi:hypothetical protein